LTELGFQVLETPLTEFLKAGGAAKCLTLRLDEPVMPQVHAGVGIESRTLSMEGHLLDSGLINRALDLIVEGGGSFQVLSFDLGEQRQSTSRAQIRVSAPDHEVMEELMSQLIDLGAVTLPNDVRDAVLAPITQAGVAPDDFYTTTIYPTEIRVQGEWVRVANQRMDGVIAVQQTPEGVVAQCKLLRDLEIGEDVVVGVEVCARPASRPIAIAPRKSSVLWGLGFPVSVGLS